MTVSRIKSRSKKITINRKGYQQIRRHLSVNATINRTVNATLIQFHYIPFFFKL